jgi:hypothetical protein
MRNPLTLWLFTLVSAFVFGLVIGLFSKRRAVAGIASATLGVSGFMAIVMSNELPQHRAQAFMLVSPFMLVPFVLMVGIGYAGGALGRKIAGHR